MDAHTERHPSARRRFAEDEGDGLAGQDITTWALLPHGGLGQHGLEFCCAQIEDSKEMPDAHVHPPSAREARFLETILAPSPASSVMISSSTEWAIRPSMMWAAPTPPSRLVSTASNLGIIPLDTFPLSSSSITSSPVHSDKRDDSSSRSAWRPATSVRKMTFAALRAAASAPATVSALML